MQKPTVHVFSFGFKHSAPPSDMNGHGGGFVFDCRALPNPYWDDVLRPFPGTDPRVVAFFEKEPDVAEFARHATGLVLFTARTYAKLDRDHLYVAFGCTGGRHRSVYLAEVLKREVEQGGFQAVLTHLHLERDTPLHEANP